MDKGYSGLSDYKGSGSSKRIEGRHNASLSTSSITIRISHVVKGEFTASGRPIKGGHGQDQIDYMDKNGIPYEINIEYNNGVRAGNLPTSTNRLLRSGNNHTWFPKEWSAHTIISAAIHVASLFKGTPAPRKTFTGTYKGVKVTIVFGEHGEISTVYPSKRQGGKKK